jgi:hypothetical protein
MINYTSLTTSATFLHHSYFNRWNIFHYVTIRNNSIANVLKFYTFRELSRLFFFKQLHPWINSIIKTKKRKFFLEPSYYFTMNICFWLQSKWIMATKSQYFIAIYKNKCDQKKANKISSVGGETGRRSRIWFMFLNRIGKSNDNLENKR